MEIFPNVDDQPHELTADEPETWVIASGYVKHDPENPKNDKYLPNGTKIEWEILRPDPAHAEGPDGSFIEKEETLTDGYARAKFRGNTKAGDVFVVRAKLVSTGEEVDSGTFKIVPGLTKHITFTNGAEILLPVDGEEFPVTAYLEDDFGNAVVNGTGVEWYDYGMTGISDDVSSVDDETTDGMAEAWLVMGPTVEEDTPVIAAVADETMESLDLNLTPVMVTLHLVTINPSPELDVHTGETGLLRAEFTHTDGSPVSDGWPVVWGTTKGAIVSTSGSTAGGEATAVLSAAGATRGTALVSVTLGDCAGPGVHVQIHFKSSASASIELEPGYVSEDDNCELQISGPPNWRARISFGDAAGVVAKYPFDRFLVNSLGNFVEDVAFGNHGVVSGVPVLDPNDERYNSAPYSLRLNGSSDSVSIPHVPRLAIKTGLSLTASIYLSATPSSGGAMIIAQKSGEYTLSVINDGQVKVRFQVNLTTGTSAVEVSGITSGELFGVNASFKAGVLKLAVGNAQSSVNVTGLITTGASPISVGASFNGNIDDFTILRVRRVAIMGANSNGEVNLGPSGTATVTLISDDPADDPDNSGVAVIHDFVIAVKVFNPNDSEDEEHDVTDHLQATTSPIVLQTQDIISFVDDLKEKWRITKYILENFVRQGLLSENDFKYLASLPNPNDMEWHRTIQAIINCGVTLGSLVFVPAKLLGVPRLLMAAQRTKAVLVLARLYRLGFTLKNFAELLQFIEFLEWVYEHYRNSWHKVVTSKRELIKLNKIFQSEK